MILRLFNEPARLMDLAVTCAQGGASRTWEDLFAEIATFPDNAVIKVHPLLWAVDGVLAKFPESHSVAMNRGFQDVLCSMLAHGGVLRHFRTWRRFPVPNPFLGITSGNVLGYEDTSIEQKCFLRHVAHQNEIKRLSKDYPITKFWEVQYEELVLQPEYQMENVWYALELPNIGVTEPPNK